MLRNLISERSFTDGKQILGTRAEMIGWGVLVMAGLLWAMRGHIVERTATQRSAVVDISLRPKGSAADVQQAFATAQKACAVKAALVPNTNPALHGGFFIVEVTADTNEQALASQAAMAKAMEATQAALPEDKRQFKVDAGNGLHTYPVMNEAMRRLDFALEASALLMAVAAQIAIVLGASVQIGTKPGDFWWRLALPLLFILIPQAGAQSGRGHRGNGGVWLFTPDRFLALLAVSIVPALLVLWLTSRSKGTQHRDPRQGRGRGTSP